LTPVCWKGATRISDKVFQARYQAGGGHDGVFDFPAHGTHAWSNWGGPLQAMLPDLQRVLNGLSRGGRDRPRGVRVEI